LCFFGCKGGKFVWALNRGAGGLGGGPGRKNPPPKPSWQGGRAPSGDRAWAGGAGRGGAVIKPWVNGRGGGPGPKVGTGPAKQGENLCAGGGGGPFVCCQDPGGQTANG